MSLRWLRPSYAAAASFGYAGSVSSSAASTLPAIGDVLAERYRLVRKIAEGGMGIIYEAEHLRLRQRVALKVLAPEGGHTKETVARFEIEARVCASLRSPNAVRVIDVDRNSSGVCFMAMELLKGRDLAQELDERKRLPLEEAVDIAMQIAAGMSEAHRLGVVHRDLKPPNVFLCHLGPQISRRLVKVLDFGISKLEASASRKLTSRFDVFGTSYYMSPEHIRSAAEVDARSDIWALGVLLFEMLTGKLPFEGTPTGVMLSIANDEPIRPTSLLPDLPSEIEQILLRCLAKNPWERFATMDELQAALAPFAPAEPIDAVLARAPREALTSSVGSQGWESTPPPPGVATSSARRGFLFAVALGVPVLITVVALRLLRSDATKDPEDAAPVGAVTPPASSASSSVAPTLETPSATSGAAERPAPVATAEPVPRSRPVARPAPRPPALPSSTARKPVNRL